MVKTLTKTGNSLAVILDKPLLDSVRIDADTPLAISTNGDVIIITPVREKEREEKLRDGMEAIHERYAGVFRRLAQ